MSGITCDVNYSAIRAGFNPEDNYCWVIPVATPVDFSGKRVLVCMRKCELHTNERSDIFSQPYSMCSHDGGDNWSVEPVAESGLEDKCRGDWKYVYNGNPKLHKKTEKVLNIGNRVAYQNDNLAYTHGGLEYSIYNDINNSWSDPVELCGLDLAERFAYNGGMQRIELPCGDILLPVYGQKGPKDKMFSVVLRCGFNGQKLVLKNIGNMLSCDIERGLYEPSLAFCNGKYYMTIRNDQYGYVAVSDDGLNYSMPERWTFYDDTDLGSYNTQQHWVSHGEKLYLVYTRRGANNEHLALFRHRAPLFMAEVDPHRMKVIRETERIIVPERGAKLGNFDVVDINENETWVVVAEWMEQRAGLISTEYGSNNSVFISRLQWQN